VRAHTRPLAEGRARGQGCLGRALLELLQLSLLLMEAPVLVVLPLAVVGGRVARSGRMACIGLDWPGQLLVARRGVRVSRKQRSSQGQGAPRGDASPAAPQ
jgi:hypothetical protein